MKVHSGPLPGPLSWSLQLGAHLPCLVIRASGSSSPSEPLPHPSCTPCSHLWGLQALCKWGSSHRWLGEQNLLSLLFLGSLWLFRCISPDFASLVLLQNRNVQMCTCLRNCNSAGMEECPRLPGNVEGTIASVTT